MVAHGLGRLGGKTSIPIVASKIITELRLLYPEHLLVFDAAVADQAPVPPVNYREQSVTVALLMLQAPLHPALHGRTVERRGREGRHDLWIAKDGE